VAKLDEGCSYEGMALLYSPGMVRRSDSRVISPAMECVVNALNLSVLGE
jgi:hypothetical protein